MDTLDTAIAVVEALSEEIKEGLQEEPLVITLPEGYYLDSEIGNLTEDVLVVLLSFVRVYDTLVFLTSTARSFQFVQVGHLLQKTVPGDQQ